MRERSTRGGTRLTELGFGAAQLGNLYRETTELEAFAAVEAAWGAGVRYFDTAPHYGLGLSERRLGAALAGHARDDYVLSTKVGRLLVPKVGGGSGRDSEGFDVPDDLTRRWDLSRDGIHRSLDASLERLGVDRIDVVYLHDPDDFAEQAVREALPALIELREQGMVGAVGAGMNQSELLADFIRRTDIDIVMVAGRFTLLDQTALADLLPAAVEHDVAVVAAAVYNSGLLSRSRPQPDAKFDYEAAPTDLLRRAGALADVCERHGVDLPSAAVAYPLRHPSVSSVVLGARTAAQVSSTVERYRTPIPEDLWVELEELDLIASDPHNLEYQ